MVNGYLDSKIKSSCCGCKVCASVCPKNAINFEYDEEGFWYPIINEETCIKCDKCRKVCPLSEYELPVIVDNNQTYAAYAKSDEILLHSASGGLFTVFSDYILNNDGIIFGHAYDENCRSICIKAETKEERDRMCGSKYFQSDMQNIYKEIKEACEKKKVLVTGTPCQIDAVKHYLGNNVPDNLLTIGLICHGVPSPKIFDDYVKIEEKKTKKKVVEVIFRGKSKGWSTPAREFHYSDGSVSVSLLRDDAFNNLFQVTDCILRPSCYKCKYAGKKRIEDISIADFWGIKTHHKEMFNDDKGVSVVLVNTSKGKKIFSAIEDRIVTKHVPLVDAQQANVPLRETIKPYKHRKLVFEEYKRYGANYILRKYMIIQKVSSSFPIRIVRKLLRMIRGSFVK